MMGNRDTDAIGKMVETMFAERMEQELTKRVGQWQDLFESIDSSLASLVEAAEGNNSKAMAQAIAGAFAAIKAPPAPQLPAPVVNVKPEISLPPAPQPKVEVVMPPTDATFEVEFRYGNGGRLSGMTVTRKLLSASR